MDQESSPTDAFERQLERGRDAISNARDVYSSLVVTEGVSDEIVEAIGDLEEELNELDRTLNVGSDDVRIATRTAQRATVLSDVFAAFEKRQRIEIEAELARLTTYAGGLDELRSEVDLSEDVVSQFDRLNRHLDMLQKLADSDRHGQVLNNDRVSLSTIDIELRKLDTKLASHAPEDHRTRTYLSISEKILTSVHDVLSSLDDDNKDKTAYGEELRTVKDYIEDAEEELDTGNPSRARELGRIAMEGTFMMYYQIHKASATAELAAELAMMLEDVGEDIDLDIDEARSSGDVDTLSEALDELIGSQVERSVTDRLDQLLQEHNGSVAQTVEATEFDVETVLEHLDQLYQRPHVLDVEVTFER